MAIGTSANVQIENEFVHAGWTEVVAGTIDGFNQASNGAIRFITEDAVGDYQREDFFGEIATLVEHRDPTAVSAQTAVPLTELRKSAVRVPRRLKLVQNTLDSFKKLGMSENEFNFALGQQLAASSMQNMLDTAILCLDAALDGQTTQEHDATAGTINIEDLVDGLNKMGDQSSDIIQWIMHSKAAHDLMKDHITNAIDGPANMVIMNGSNASLGRPILQRDASALFRDATTDNYVTLGLTANAAVVQLLSPPKVLSKLVEGLDNIVMSYQAEWDFMLSLRGFTWDETNGGAAPTDATLSTSTNWDKIATDAQNLAGCHIISL